MKIRVLRGQSWWIVQSDDPLLISTTYKLIGWWIDDAYRQSLLATYIIDNTNINHIYRNSCHVCTKDKSLSVTPGPQEHHCSKRIFYTRSSISSLNLFRNFNATFITRFVTNHHSHSCRIRSPEFFSHSHLGFTNQRAIAGELLRFHTQQQKVSDNSRDGFVRPRYWRLLWRCMR